MYSVELSKRADKLLEKLDSHIHDRKIKRLNKLGNNPVPRDTKYMGRHKGDKIFRFRIGDFRCLYKIVEKERVVLIAKIDKRPRFYKR